MKEIAIVLDSSADISESLAKELGVFVIRMPIIINDKQYYEETDISDADIIKAMKNGETVKTSQPPLGNVLNLWEKLLKTHDEIIHIPLSRKLSGSFQSAMIASESYKNKVFVVDALSACCPIQILVKYAKEMIKNGYDAQTIKDKIENESNMFCALIPNDLVYLKRGGRISPAAMALANLLKIVPVLKVENGMIDVLGKVRTRRKAISFAIEKVIDIVDLDEYDFVFTSVDAGDVSEYIAVFEKSINKKVMKGNIKAVVLAHTGPGTIGFARVKKIKINENKNQ